MTSTVSSKLQPYFQTLPGKEAGVEGGGGEGHRESVMEPAIFLGRPGLGWEWVAQIIFKWHQIPYWARSLWQVQKFNGKAALQGPNNKYLQLSGARDT